MRRTFLEKLATSHVYECRDCELRQSSGSLFLIDRSCHANCPSCGNLYVTLRQSPDMIDAMYKSFTNSFNRMLGGKLYKCRHCRLQFYDRRPLCSDAGQQTANKIAPSVRESHL